MGEMKSSSSLMYFSFQSYFCGQGLECVQFNNPLALQRAKKNIEQLYAVVGIMERFNETVMLMENKMPQMLTGLLDEFNNC